MNDDSLPTIRQAIEILGFITFLLGFGSTSAVGITSIHTLAKIIRSYLHDQNSSRPLIERDMEYGHINSS